jgi:hypothetical protein
VLALRFSRSRVAYAVVDPWEIRSAGTFARPRSLASAVRRLARREKPTVVVTSRAIAGAVSGALEGLGLTVQTVAPRRPPVLVARELFPELGWYAPTPDLERVTRTAIGHLLRSPITPRRYAHRSRRPAVRPVGVPTPR